MKFINNLEKSHPDLDYQDEKLFTGPGNSYWLIPGKILCGEYPHDIDDITELTDSFIDLVKYGRYGSIYKSQLDSNINYRNFPITDHSIPSKIFCKQIIKYIENELKNKKTIYIHCYGGHGRTGIIAAILLKHIQSNISGIEALEVISHLHCYRNDGGCNIQAPETKEQMNYVVNY